MVGRCGEQQWSPDQSCHGKSGKKKESNDNIEGTIMGYRFSSLVKNALEWRLLIFKV